MDDHVVEVRGCVLLMGPEDYIHKPLERDWGPVQAEGKGPVLPVATWGREGSLRLGAVREWYLPVAFREVQSRNIPGPSQAIQEFIHSGHWVPSNSETSFRRRKSLQKRRVPSGFGTKTIGLDHGLRDGSITPNFSNLLNFILNSLPTSLWDPVGPLLSQ